MERLIGLAMLLVVPLAAAGAAAGDDAVRAELKALEGTWKAVSMEAGGTPLPMEGMPPFTFIVAADGKCIARTPQGDEQATMSVDPAKDPKTIDNLHQSGTTKGKTQYGIYRLEGDTWTVCMTPPGVRAADRPTSFATKDTSNVVFVFRRATPDDRP